MAAPFGATWGTLIERCEDLPEDATLITPLSTRRFRVTDVQQQRIIIEDTDTGDAQPLQREQFEALVEHTRDSAGEGYDLERLSPKAEPYAAVLAVHPRYVLDQEDGRIVELEEADESAVLNETPHLSTTTDDEQPLLRDAALGVINALATAYPEDIVEHLPRIVAALNDETTRSMALAVLQTIAKRDAAGLAPVVDDVRGVFRTLATVDIDAGESVTDPAGRRVQLTEGDPSRRLVLSVLFELAKHDPTWILAVQPHLTELVEANVDGWQTALDILRELK